MITSVIILLGVNTQQLVIRMFLIFEPPESSKIMQAA